MIDYKAGEITLVLMPLTTGQPGKLRPGLILLDSGDDDVLVARLTTHSLTTPFDVSITDWSGANLRSATTARLHKLFTLNKSLVRQRIGHLQPADRQKVADVLKQMFGNW